MRRGAGRLRAPKAFHDLTTPEASGRRVVVCITVADMRILLRELSDGGLEGIQLARALTGKAVSRATRY
jgi:hypothetical protein